MSSHNYEIGFGHWPLDQIQDLRLDVLQAGDEVLLETVSPTADKGIRLNVTQALGDNALVLVTFFGSRQVFSGEHFSQVFWEQQVHYENPLTNNSHELHPIWAIKRDQHGDSISVGNRLSLWKKKGESTASYLSQGIVKIGLLRPVPVEQSF